MKVSLALALLLSSCALSAATISYTNYPSTTILVSAQHSYPTFVYPDVELPLFDPALGTLTNITLSARSILAGSIPGGWGGFTNYGYAMVEFAGVSFGQTNGGCGGSISGSSSFPDNVGTWCNEYYSRSLTEAGVADPFYGTGNGTLTWPGMYAEAVIGYGNSVTVALVSGSYRTVTYEYDAATPEPSTASMLLGSGAILGFFVRRRRARS